ncbi:hypothetical protein H920_16166 [Fukomys damarensis]|uniref:Uncharacterized protein n=1 Tax=Fukomys damarensis TaxID=885580 RepID=A0A091CX56_FUKDA|nr:hypothetical protein H920_16166 [Fukomys damarensis]
MVDCVQDTKVWGTEEKGTDEQRQCLKEKHKEEENIIGQSQRCSRRRTEKLRHPFGRERDDPFSSVNAE